jgi:hypothetical protein
VTTGEIIAMVVAAIGVSGPIGALILKLVQLRTSSRERIERDKIAMNGKTTPTLVELLDEALGENRRLRADVKELQRALTRNTEATVAIADEVGPEAGRKARRAVSDPHGVTAQREDTGRHRAQRALPKVHTDIDSERPYPTRPTRRTRDE